MASALVPLQNITLGSSQASVSFGSIPSTFRDLRLVVNGTIGSTVDALVLRFNGDTGSNYSFVYATGDGSNATSGGTTTNLLSVGVIGSTQSVSTIDIMDYSATDKHKTVLGRGNTPGWGVRMNAARWASTSAITSILVYTEASVNLAAGTTLALYGVKA